MAVVVMHRVQRVMLEGHRLVVQMLMVEVLMVEVLLLRSTVAGGGTGRTVAVVAGAAEYAGDPQLAQLVPEPTSTGLFLPERGIQLVGPTCHPSQLVRVEATRQSVRVGYHIGGHLTTAST